MILHAIVDILILCALGYLLAAYVTPSMPPPIRWIIWLIFFLIVLAVLLPLLGVHVTGLG